MDAPFKKKKIYTMEKIWLKEVFSPFSFNRGIQLTISVSTKDLLKEQEAKNRLSQRELEKSWEWFNRFSQGNLDFGSDIFKTIERETQITVF